jgi:predicted nuclease of predicted toxin-antitoxin system
MRFLADESCDVAVVRALREAGHDVTSVRDTMRGATDQWVLDAALRERRLLVTEDKDFGELVFAGGAAALGVLLLRYPIAARSRVARRVVDFVTVRAAELDGSFVVIEPSRSRVRRLGR